MYKLSNLAAEDFAAIYEYTLVRFGSQQADTYTDELDRVFHMLAESPRMGQECPEIGTDMRRHDHQRHAIFYRQRKQDIFVLRILHQQMEPMIHFFTL